MIGQLLRSVRAGEARSAWEHPNLREVPQLLHVSSTAFEPGAPMPNRFAGRGVGSNVSPPLAWRGVPEGAAELALIVEDPDAPLPRPFVHAVVAGIPPGWSGLPEGAIGADATLRVGRASLGQRGYLGPRPVSGHGPHSYLFQVVAVDQLMELSAGFTKRDLIAAMSGHAMARGRLDGTFER